MGLQKEEAERLVFSVARREHHAFGDAETHLARGEVRDHDRVAADEIRGLVGALDPGEDVAGAAFAEVERQLQELRRTIDLLAVDDLRDAQVDLREVVDRAFGGDRFAAGKLRVGGGFFGGRFGDAGEELVESAA